MEQQPNPNDIQKPELDYRHEDISNTRLIVYIGGGFLIFTVLLIVLIFAFSGKPDSNKGTDIGKEISAQRLALQTREDSLLTTYALTDSVNLIYRIPIDSAMNFFLYENAELTGDPTKKIRSRR